jgi:flagellar biosynthetic protein FliO
VKDKRRKVAMMFAGVVVAGSLVGLAARPTDQAKPDASAPQTQRFLLNDPNLARQGDLGIGSKELFFKMMLSVLLVVALAAGALYLSKKVLPNITKAGGREIQIIETAYLGPRKALHLVEIGGQRLLIGSTNESIAKLAEVGDTWLDLSKQELDHSVGM